MAEKLAILIKKVEELLDLLDKLKQEKRDLTSENRQVLKELSKAKKEYNRLKIASADKNEKVRTKLTGIFERLERLEELTS